MLAVKKTSSNTHKTIHWVYYKGFTLTELVVSIMIWLAVLACVFFVFRSFSDNFLAIRYLNRAYDGLNTFTNDYQPLRADYPILLVNSGGYFWGSWYGFQSLAFTNSGQSGGFLLLAIDFKNQSIVTWTGGLYTQILPAIMPLSAAEVVTVSSDFWTFLSGANLSRMKIYQDLPIIKLWYTPINGTNVWKLDFFITPSYYEVFQGQLMIFAVDHPLFEYFPFSYLQ